jgi:nitrite reductase/ring-hydroxylating ferredoxin subunit
MASDMGSKREADGWICVGTLAELERDGVRVLRVGRAAVAVFHHDGNVSAVDNRCPHLGFPLHRGTVRDGVLTCHWHHARFDLAGGCTFNPFADDAVPYPVAVEDDVVWVSPKPVPRDRRAHHLAKLEDGLERNLQLVLAKSVLGLQGVATTTDMLARSASFGVRNRAAGWSPGLSIQTALANVAGALDRADVPRAQFHGLLHVARDTAGHAPRFALDPLRTSERRPQRLTAWFRDFCEVRADAAAERTLLAAVSVGLASQDLAAMIVAACTDHRYVANGHVLDFANKAFELLDHVGWDHGGEILPSLIAPLTSGQRMEETSAWRHPVDLATLVAEHAAQLAWTPGAKHTPWNGHEQLAELALDADPAILLSEIVALIKRGVAPTDVSTAIAYAAALRIVHFPTTNDDRDWDTVLHVFTYANAVDQAVRRAPSTAAMRGILDAGAAVHLERFLNVPKRPIPAPSGHHAQPADLLDLLDRQGHVDDAAQVTADLLAQRRGDEVIRTLGHALLREDAQFHSYQVLEAGLRQHHNLAPRAAADHVLLAITRFLAARFPTVRSRQRTWSIAERLHRGERVHDDVDE